MSSNRTIAKNTLFLYFRMMLVMAVGLYTSRIVLKELGISDYGIYSLVGGFVALFSFLNVAMSSATQRFLTFEIGTDDFIQLKKTFSGSLTIHFLIAVLILVVAETVGLWYVNYMMVFPENRAFAVNIVYQFSVVATLIGIIQVPYDALIIAKERMNVYAYIGIVEVLLKLGIVFMLIYFGSDKLITYAVLTFLVALGIFLFYRFYCRAHYKESRYHFHRDKKIYRGLIGFSGWSLLGSASYIGKEQGYNVLLNLFFGTAINAAYGVMSMVKNVVTSFITNFQMASNPQIVKQYASDEHEGMFHLINQTSKFSFFLSVLIVSPIFININYVLGLWLVTVPPDSGILIRIALLIVLIDSVFAPISIGVGATGNIKWFQIIVSGLNLLNLPVSYLLLKFGVFKEVQTVMYVWLAISILSAFPKLLIFKKLANFDLKSFLQEVILNIAIISIICMAIGYLILRFLEVNNFITFAFSSGMYVVLIAVAILIIGMSRSERVLIRTEILKRVWKRNYGR